MSTATLLALGLSAVVGLSLGALGGGGAILTLPILVYVGAIDVRTAIAISMVVVGGTSAVAAVVHARRGCFHGKAAALFAVTGMVSAYLGSFLTNAVAERTLMLIFAALMLVVGTAMLRERRERPPAAQCRTTPCLTIGTVVGGLTGFLGVGGGFLIVPALILFAGIETRVAIGTSLAIIAFNSLAGLVGQLRHGALDWPLALAFLSFALAGMAGGLQIAHRIPAPVLRRAFAALVIGLALAIAGLTMAGAHLP